MSGSKGSRRERELVNMFDESGFVVMRAPASGGAASRELPDVFAGNGVLFAAVEVKSSAGDPIYIDEEEVAALRHFAEGFNADALIGVRFDREDWYFFTPNALYRTDGGNYRVKKETALDSGTSFRDLTASEESA